MGESAGEGRKIERGAPMDRVVCLVHGQPERMRGGHAAKITPAAVGNIQATATRIARSRTGFGVYPIHLKRQSFAFARLM
jgi:hypothetical protein